MARSIMQAASVHLTPVTLELGGKCPCMIFGRVDIAAAARRLAWAKFFNAGQSCVAPDYVLCTPATMELMVPALRETLQEFYSKEPQTCPDLCRIVSDRHWSRLMDLLKRSSGKVIVGGDGDQEDRYFGEIKKLRLVSPSLIHTSIHVGILNVFCRPSLPSAPTVVVDVAEDDALMQGEIFGPILPIITVSSLEKGIEFVNYQEKPLALYIFSDESSVRMQHPAVLQYKM